MKKIDEFSHEFCTSVVREPKKWRIISIAIFLITLLGIFQIKTNFSVKMWLYDDDPRIQALEVHEKLFGSSETMDVIIYKEDGIFDQETIKTLQNITNEMWQISDIVRVESLTNHNWITTEYDDIIITPFLDEEVSLDRNTLEDKKRLSTSDDQLVNNFISPNGKLAYIRSFLKTYQTNAPYEKIVKEVEQMLKKYERPGLKIHLSGIAFINESLRRASDRDMALVFPIIVLILTGILFYFFKTVLGVIFPFSLIVLSIASTFGVEGFLGLNFNNIISAVPAVLIAIGLADAIHILIGYRHNILFEDQDNETAAINSLIKNFIPTILTTITTSVGFFSLMTADITPIHDLGVLSAIGTMFAWFYTYFFLGTFLKYIKFKPKKEVNEKLKGTEFLYNICYRYKNYINIIFPILAVFMVYLGTKNVINADPVEYFAETTDIKQTFNRVQHEFGGSRAIELVFDSQKTEGIKDPEFLKKSDQLIKWLYEKPEVVKVNSIIQVIKKMNQTLNEGKDEFYKIPDSRRAVADLLFLYTLGLPEGMDLKNQVTLDNRRFRVILMWDVNDTMHAITKTEEILNKAKELGIHVYEGGQSPIYNRVNDLVVKTFFTSMSLSIPIIFLIVLFVFKDLKLSLMSLIPNLFPLAIASGIMYLNGDQVNIGNVIVFSVCLGIAVDDTIHFIANYKLKVNRGMDSVAALKSTLEQTGKALVLTTIMLSVGFGLFILGEFIPNQKFGIYCAIILFLALFADLVLLPAILLSLGETKRTQKI